MRLRPKDVDPLSTHDIKNLLMYVIGPFTGNEPQWGCVSPTSSFFVTPDCSVRFFGGDFSFLANSKSEQDSAHTHSEFFSLFDSCEES
jgi:hypothetical protein